jgi:hypothetical protein
MEVLVEKYTRQANDEWVLKTYKNPEDEFIIEAIDFTLNIGPLYRNVTFDEPKRVPHKGRKPRSSKQ